MVTEIHKAPEFTLNDHTNAPVSLSQFSGQNVVLFFYPKDNTPGCTLESQDFSALKEEFLVHNTVVYGVSKDSVQSHQNFCEKQNLTVPLLSDPEMTIIASYGVWQEKKNYGKTYMGIVRTTILIDGDGMLRKMWKNVTVKGHAQSVLQVVKDL